MRRTFITVLCSMLLLACGAPGSAPIDNGSVHAGDSLQLQLRAMEQRLLAEPGNASLYADRALINERMDSLDRAESDWKRAIAIEANEAKWLIGLGDLYYRKARIADAEEQFTKAVLLAGQNTEARLKLSELKLLQREYTQAMGWANDALRIDAQLPRGYFLKGWIHMEAGDTALAMSSYRTAIEQDPDMYDAYIALGLLHAARREAIALQYYNTALELRPRSVEAWYDKGMFLQEAGADSAALACYARIKEIDPRNAMAWYNTGYVLLERQEKYPEARVQFAEAIKLFPTYAQAYYNRGLTYELEGRLDSALIDYQRALALVPDLTIAAEGLGRLQQKGVRVPRP